MSALDYYSDADLADKLGVTERQVVEWRRRYGWPCLKIGRQVRYTAADIASIERLHRAGGERATTGLPDQTARSIARSA